MPLLTTVCIMGKLELQQIVSLEFKSHSSEFVFRNSTWQVKGMERELTTQSKLCKIFTSVISTSVIHLTDKLKTRKIYYA